MTNQGPIHMKKCLRCGHEWYPRTPIRPVICPACGSAYWDKERTFPARKPAPVLASPPDVEPQPEPEEGEVPDPEESYGRPVQG